MSESEWGKACIIVVMLRRLQVQPLSRLFVVSG
jgi:hypothetical protein